jgi:preprotein translocase subunit SecD
MTVLPQLEHELLAAHERIQGRRAGGLRGLRARAAALGGVVGPARGRRGRLGRLAPVISVLVVVAVAAVFLGIHGTAPRPARGSSTGRGPELIFAVQATASAPVVNRATLARAVSVLRQRIDALGVAGAQVKRSGAHRIAVTLPAGVNVGLAARELAGAPTLAFYDWEADALTPSGRTVASQEPASPLALQISQGRSPAAPGSPGAGGLPLYQAVALAATQPQQVGSDNTRGGDEYYLFGASRRAACAAAERAQHGAAAPDGHCLLSGPVDDAAGVPRSEVLRQLAVGLAAGVSPAQGRLLEIRQGTVVLQAASGSFADAPAFGSPAVRYYVLRDRVALSDDAIANAVAGTDSGGTPDVTLTFTAAGRSAFQRLTARVAARGNAVSTSGDTLEQHIAIALDGQLLTIASIDFRVYPDGIIGASGADISGDFTAAVARRIAHRLQLALPVGLRLVGEK